MPQNDGKAGWSKQRQLVNTTHHPFQAALALPVFTWEGVCVDGRKQRREKR